MSSHIDSIKTKFFHETIESKIRILGFYPMIDVMVRSIEERFIQVCML